MPRGTRTRAPLLGAFLALATSCALLTTSAAALRVETAPGRVLIPVANGRAQLSAAVPLPGGGALLAGVVEHSGLVYLAKVTATGAVDPSFGSEGIAAVDAQLAFEQLIVEPGGRILLIGRHSPKGLLGPLPWGERHLPLVAVRLNADGAVDTAYGDAGTAVAGIEGGCQCQNVAVLGADGTLTLTGQQEARVSHPWGTEATYRWALARLTPAGALDPSFGTKGIALVPGEEGVGLSLEAGLGSSLIAQGQARVRERNQAGGVSEGPEHLMTRITASGAVDPGYGGGKPFELPVYSLSDSPGPPYPLPAVAGPDGRVAVETFPVPANSGRPGKNLGIGLVGYSATGALDKTFGYGGTLNLEEAREPLGSQLVAEPDGSILAVHRRGSTKRTDNVQAVPGVIEFERVTRSGLLDGTLAPPGKAVSIPFGGGTGEPLPNSLYTYPEVTLTLTQNSFLGTDSSPRAVRLSDGDVLLAGNVELATPRPPARRTTDTWALALLTPGLALDPAAGAPARTPLVEVSAPPQGAKRDAAQRRMLVDVDSTAPGLALVTVRAGRRSLASRLVAILGAGRTTVQVPLTRRAGRYLAAHTRGRFYVSVAFRDLLEQPASASAPLRLG